MFVDPRGADIGSLADAVLAMGFRCRDDEGLCSIAFFDFNTGPDIEEWAQRLNQAISERMFGPRAGSLGDAGTFVRFDPALGGVSLDGLMRWLVGKASDLEGVAAVIVSHTSLDEIAWRPGVLVEVNAFGDQVSAGYLDAVVDPERLFPSVG
jgi:hypothetical protein